ncbi:membrane protein [Azorhizobium oxalatiphilum]|uniref:Membrane protein n=1 Tax=Azorhizobium oxalatiphilum TaxID=980631 RepID=A0A917BJH0_9HYPH|nr:NfeD family protein [Azorhizobium oxalatiphilum]GGF45249.1 membrane protein [Azorhizobium oxalatiphilum]
MTFLTNGLWDASWAWFVLGGVLLVAEIILPGAFLLWLGLAALVTGFIVLAAAVSWQMQIVAFALLAVVAVVIGRQVSARARPSDHPFLNRRADGQVGRVFTLEEPIVGGTGRVRIDDTIWRVDGPDLPAGAKVIVLKTDGAVLVVGAA